MRVIHAALSGGRAEFCYCKERGKSERDRRARELGVGCCEVAIKTGAVRSAGESWRMERGGWMLRREHR